MNMYNVSGKKVKILSSYDPYSLEERINEFLNERKNIWNIQYQTTASERGLFKFSALIIYDPNPGDGKEQ